LKEEEEGVLEEKEEEEEEEVLEEKEEEEEEEALEEKEEEEEALEEEVVEEEEEEEEKVTVVEEEEEVDLEAEEERMRILKDGTQLPSLDVSSRRSSSRNWKRSICSPSPSRNTKSSIGFWVERSKMKS